MNTSTLTRKVGALEKNVISEKPSSEDTYLGTNKKEEIELFRRSNEIQEKQKAKLIAIKEKLRLDPTGNYADEIKAALTLSCEEETILQQSRSIYVQRVIHLFDNAVAQHCHLNIPVYQSIFYERLNWFLFEMTEWLHNLDRDMEIMGSPGFFELCHGEQERKHKEVNDNWRDYLSPESYKRYRESHCPEKSLDEIRLTLANRTPEQITQDKIKIQKEQEREQKQAEQDRRCLREKCSTCPDKCKWYNKQNQNVNPQEPSK
ncbi:MAG: hypothetical protein FWF66_00390 [Candidatus Bathyarchaeota archaeon]|nr:hypothetical protein [Candidatus Termiticorpusculum sp.]